MLPGKLINPYKKLHAIVAGIVILFISSCAVVVPKNYPKRKPFVYEYKINLEGNFTNKERIDLKSKLENQLDDSIHIRKVAQLYRQVLRKPPVYDSTNADRSVTFMQVLLHSMGYFNDTIRYVTKIDTVNKDQYRTTINFYVKPGIPVRLDSIRYNLQDSELQKLTESAMTQSLLKKGDPFAQVTISNEFDRLTDLYRSNGYLRFTRDELIGLWDTLNLSLLKPTLDPFEQFEMLQRLKDRKVHPTANLEIQLRPNYDKNKLRKYYVGNITIFPDYSQDSSTYSPKETIVDGVKIIYFKKLFKPKLLPQNVYLVHGQLYNQDKYFKTINRFNSLGSWRLVNVNPQIRSNSDTVDFAVRLSPAKKYAFTTTLEGSLNQSIISGNLFGIALNAGLQNRNFARTANQTSTNIRYGIELGNATGVQFVQSKQLSISHNIYFPRPIPNLKLIPEKIRDNFRTIFSINAANTDRKDLYNLTTFNASWGYEFSWKNKKHPWQNNLASIKLPNIEYSLLNKRDSLNKLIDSTPSLKNIFTDGFISSIIASYNMSGGRGKNLNILRANVEESGLLTSLIKSPFLDTQLYRFVKIDLELARKIQYNKSSVALHFFGGVGYELGSTTNPTKRNSLPFFKEYFAGGPNSMRAWALRRLGPGSTIKDFSGSSGTPDRYGDVQLEANAEYRFPIANIPGGKLNGAFFTDIGNVWFLKKSAGLPEEVFSFNRLGKDIAIGAGAGLRVDFSFFVIRFDYSYKVKDPSPETKYANLQNKWFGYKLSQGDQFQLGIGYPFIF